MNASSSNETELQDDPINMDIDPQSEFFFWKWIFDFGTRLKKSDDPDIFEELSKEVDGHLKAFSENFVSVAHQWNLFTTDLSEFSNAIDWEKDKNWIGGIFAFHLIIFTTIIIARDVNIRSVLLFMLLGLTFSCQYINAYFGNDENWKSFASQNYFHEDGVFILVVFALPCIGNALLCLIYLYLEIVNISIRAKRIQIARQRRNVNNNPQAAAD